MKTFLIVFAILILLGIVIFLLIRKPEKVIDDDSIVKPGADYDIDKKFVTEGHKPDAPVDTPADACLQEGIDYSKESEKVVEETEEEVHIPEHCRIPKEAEETLPNKYFFNIHKYISKKGRSMCCLVCSAIIGGNNYRIVVKNCFYPYVGSYTLKIAKKLHTMFTDNLTIDEFYTLGSTNFDGVKEIIENFVWYDVK